MDTVLKVKNLKKHYGEVLAVDNLNLEVHRGEIFGLLGHNGAGKSTAIDCMLGVKSYDSGDVEILGMNPVDQRYKVFEKVGVQFQQSSYQNKITVKEICEMTYSLYKNPSDWKPLLDTFGLAPMHKRLVSELSGGERQKLSVLLALIPNPELIFLDELTTGLDPKARRDVWKHLQLLKERGLTIFLTSHYMDEVQNLCDRICILSNGKTVIMDTVPNVIAGSQAQSLEDAYLYYTGEEL